MTVAEEKSHLINTLIESSKKNANEDVNMNIMFIVELLSFLPESHNVNESLNNIVQGVSALPTSAEELQRNIQSLIVTLFNILNKEFEKSLE